MSQLIHQRIEDTLKDMLPIAQQADEILVGLQVDKQARYSAIFPKHGLFTVQSRLFLPYLEELDTDFKALPEQTDPAFQPLLTSLMKKIQVMFQLLGSFHEIQDDEKAVH